MQGSFIRLVRWAVACLAVFVIAPAAVSASPAPEGLLGTNITQTVDAPEIYIYQGEEVSSEVVLADNLACVQLESQNMCFDNVSEAEEAYGGAPATRTSKAQDAGGSSESVARLSCAVNLLWEYRDVDYTGTAPWSLTTFGVFANYSAANNNKTTSFQTGKGLGRFAGHEDGAGPAYDGAGDGYCGYQPNLRPTGWNNRFSSRARINP